MTKHTILFPYYQRYQYYQNQNNVNQQDANESGHHHKKSIPLLSPSAGWLRVVCFPHYTIHQCKAQSKICLLAIFQTVLPKNVKTALVKSEKMTTVFRHSATCAPVFCSARQPPSGKMEAAAAIRCLPKLWNFLPFLKKSGKNLQNPESLDRFRQNFPLLFCKMGASHKILRKSRKDGYKMLNVPKEYLLLFNAITDAEETLGRLRSSLIAAQQKAEELFVEEGDDQEPAEEKLHNAC